MQIQISSPLCSKMGTWMYHKAVASKSFNYIMALALYTCGTAGTGPHLLQELEE